MENIIEPNESFDFSKLTLAYPSGIQGGAYFTKIEYNNKPLYIQTTKSLTRQGIVKTGKKYYCDLMFDNNSDSLINWFENLEETCQKLIYNKSETWFQNALEISDIESAFNSILRVYRSGKYYLVRTNVKTAPITNDPVIKIYNEHEVSLTTNDVTSETNIISILEIQGIKFTTRNFQIDVELKQIMVLANEKMFDNCLIKKNKLENLIPNSNPNLDEQKNRFQVKEDLEITNTKITDSIINTENTIKNNEFIEEPLDSLEKDILELTQVEEKKNTIKQEDNVEEMKDSEYIINNSIAEIESETNMDIVLDIEELEMENIEEPQELKEVDLNVKVENNLETLTLKKPNQVYFELYKEARQKAKTAKKMAILAYLEAKNIKKSYMIENLNDSDSDFDAEIDEVSESELEGL